MYNKPNKKDMIKIGANEQINDRWQIVDTIRNGPSVSRF